MENWVVKLTEWGGQYRVTLPKELVIKTGLDKVKYLIIDNPMKGLIRIERYRTDEEEDGRI